MPGVANSALADLIATTLPDLPNMEMEVALNQVHYPVVDKWFGSDKVQVHDGTSILRNIMLDTSGNARHVRLFQKTPINITDTQHQIIAPWCQVQTHWSIERREVLRNRKPSAFVDLLKARRLDAMLDLAELLEGRAVLPPSAATDDLNPMGLLYWLSFAPDGATSATALADNGGFCGRTIRWNNTGVGGTTVKGGIDTATHPKWRNYADIYAAMTVADGVLHLRRAFHACEFQSPMMVRDLSQGPLANFRLYCDLTTLITYEGLVNAANTNDMGTDLDKFHGVTVFRRCPMIYLPALDGMLITGGGGVNTTDTHPVIGVNHQMFYPVVQEGDWLRESEPYDDVEQHNSSTVFVDGSYQFFCKNVRRAGFVVHITVAA
jgi:hypothetical protein